MYELLVVDDEEIICNGIKSMIERTGITAISQIRTAFDAQKALSYLDEFRPDILITDIKMPGMSGLQLMEEILDRRPNIKCIVISGYGRFQYAKEAFKLGAVDYLLKPVSICELREALLKTLSMLDNTSINEVFREMTDFKEVSNIDTENYLQTHNLISKIEDKNIKTKKMNSVSEIAKTYVKNNLDKSVNMAVIANNMNLSYAYFSKIFRDETGITFSDYVMGCRMGEAATKLKRTTITIREIAASVGYDNPKHFTRAFKNYFGISPQHYRNNSEEKTDFVHLK